MIHASDVLLGLLLLMTLLLAAFIAAVIRANLDTGGAPAQPPTPAAPRQPARSPARTSAAAQGWRPGRVSVAFMAGLIIAAPGIWLFLSTGTGACALQAAAICAQGYVLLTTTQIFGGALALAGIALIFAAAVLALRDQD